MKKTRRPVQSGRRVLFFSAVPAVPAGKKAVSGELFRVRMYLSQRARAIKEMASKRQMDQQQRKPG
ncbi:hypothetical protein IAI51_18740 [Pseudomonas sp. N40(2020)]|uniref:hypothetical protein n=1 Tax=Pseudomonas sp. N40(2020) TaxID=2767798 RepID=UPI001656A871|nr:hypothetical protein [Pseudomonas sp. N40(2020)]MBC8998573.1 hypothetical protein [Pseudomonas sp. N40(2020)]